MPKKNIKGPLNAFFKVKSDLSVNNGILLRRKRLVIPGTSNNEIRDASKSISHLVYKQQSDMGHNTLPRAIQEILVYMNTCIVADDR